MSRILSIAILLLPAAPAALAQPDSRAGAIPRHYPINQHVPPGRAAKWALQSGTIRAGYFQPVQVKLPGPGKVTFYDGAFIKPLQKAAPAQLALEVGRVYRFRIDIDSIKDVPELKAITLYPSVELFDRLHPPPGKKHDFPIPMVITREELIAVLQGKVLTKVVYLEQPQLAWPRTRPDELAVAELDPQVNAVAEADRRGRPMAIIRLGSRMPAGDRPDPRFWGRLHRVLPSTPSK